MKFILILAILGRISLSQNEQLTLLGSAKVDNPSYFTNFNGASANSLIFSSFGALSSGKLYSIPYDQLSGDFSKVSPELLTDKLKWPNEIEQIPQERFGEEAIIIPDGFLVPGKATGSISVITMKDNSVVKLTTDKSSWFYHRAEWIDCSGDGILDIMTARAKKPMIGSSKGELICLINPGNIEQVPWEEKILVEGPEVNFEVAELDNNLQTIEVIAAQFFSQKVMLYQFEVDSFKLLNQITIDDQSGQAYDVQVKELNNDGKKQILASNHESSQDKSAIFCYEIPENIIEGSYNKHIIASGFKVQGFSFGAGAPGFVYTVYPQVNGSGKPLLLVAGDGDHKFWMLTPNGDFSYEKIMVQDVGGTVGSLGLGDWNKDGWLDVAVPNYDKSVLYFYTFASQ